MKRGQGRLQRKGIVSLSAITTPTIIALAGIIIFIVFGLELPLLFDHVATGNSFFFPSIPVLNLLDFLPGHVTALQFTLGNLVDLIIDIYIVLSIGIIPYRWHECAREPGNPIIKRQLVDLFDLTSSHLEQRASNPGPARGLDRKSLEGATCSDFYCTDDRFEEKRVTGTTNVPSRKQSSRRNVSHVPVGINIPMTRNAHMDAILSTMLACFPVPSFYPSSRVRLQCAHKISCFFFNKTRIKVTKPIDQTN